MSKVHELDPMSTNCDRVVIACKYFLWTELQNVSSFKKKKNVISSRYFLQA